MIDLETLPLKIGSYERKDLSSRMFKNTGRNGYGCSINPTENLATFGMWIPCGATILREKVTTNEEVVELLKKTGDIISFIKEKLNKSLSFGIIYIQRLKLPVIHMQYTTPLTKKAH